jgi:hypothetical protein
MLQTDGGGRLEALGHLVGGHDHGTAKAVEQEQLTRLGVRCGRVGGGKLQSRQHQ